VRNNGHFYPVLKRMNAYNLFVVLLFYLDVNGTFNLCTHTHYQTMGFWQI